MVTPPSITLPGSPAKDQSGMSLEELLRERSGWKTSSPSVRWPRRPRFKLCRLRRELLPALRTLVTLLDPGIGQDVVLLQRRSREILCGQRGGIRKPHNRRNHWPSRLGKGLTIEEGQVPLVDPFDEGPAILELDRRPRCRPSMGRCWAANDRP